MLARATYGLIVAIGRLTHRVAGLIAAAGIILAALASAASGEPLRVVALGDSLTAGLGLSAQDAFPAKLQKALTARGLAVDIENAGVSGDTAAGGLARLDWSVPDGTRAVLVALGANDMLRGADPEEMRRALDEIVRRLQARGMKVMLLGMLAAPNLGAEYRERYDRVFEDVAAKHSIAFDRFLLQDVAGVAELNQPDGLHPNARGVDVMVARLTGPVEVFLRTVSP